PRTIAVVTSPTGAVIRDILHRLADRFPSRVLVWPVLVQGHGSAEQVAAAIRGFSDLPDDLPRPDLLIVARGGGSIEDLWGFNEEIVVRAIADCPIPVISAVGHETDTTLADFAADRRAPTPTAAAEMAVPVRAELAATIDDLAHRKKRAISRPVTLGRERLLARIQRLPKPEALLQPQVQKLDDLGERLARGLKDCAARSRERLQADPARLSAPLLLSRIGRAKERVESARFSTALIQARLARDSERFQALDRLRQSLNPKAPLARGFVLVKDAKGNLVRSKAVAAGLPSLAIEFADGVLDARPGIVSSPPAKTKTAKAGPDRGQSPQDDLFA
ncbi:MAG: exodeoxyribonuclease VII large subunit, partial [Pontixanthobacter sp.]